MSYKLTSLAKLLGLAALAATLSVSGSVIAADHAESPGADADPAADLADVFIFPSPEASNKTVGAITFGGRPAPRSRIDATFYCDSKVLYTFNIDRADANGTFDNVPDVQIFARLGTNSAGGCGLKLENVPGAGQTFSGPIGQVFTSSGGMRAFAGLANDPFFFDAEGFTALVNSFATAGQSGDLVTAFGLGTRPRRDSFANRNVSAIVFEMDNDALAPIPAAGTRPKIRVWGTTARLAS